MRKLFTSESVTEGHPDKVCDQISDAVLDDILSQDPAARVACETCTTTGMVLLMGEVTTEGYTRMDEIARQVILDIGYSVVNRIVPGEELVTEGHVLGCSTCTVMDVDEWELS